jgi:hypothetical protein
LQIDSKIDTVIQLFTSGIGKADIFNGQDGDWQFTGIGKGPIVLGILFGHADDKKDATWSRDNAIRSQ